MKKKYEFDENLLIEIETLFDDSRSKSEIENYIFSKTEEFNSVLKYINEMKRRDENRSFKRKSNNWDSIISFYNSDEIKSKENLQNHLMNSLELSEDQSKKYISSYYYILSEIYKIEFKDDLK